MKPTDKITVEITLAELAKIYAVMAHTTGTASELHALGDKLFREIANLEILDDMSDHIIYGRIGYHMVETEWLNSIFLNQETEQQERIRKLKEVIAEAQKQIEELEKMEENY